MNLSTVKTIVWYAIGGLTGGFVGKVIAEYVLEQIEEKEWKEHVEEVIEWPITNKQDLQYGPLDENEAIDDGDVMVKPEVPAMKPQKAKKPEGKKPVKVINYNELSKNQRIKDSIEEVSKKYLGENAIPMGDDKSHMVRVITLEEYADAKHADFAKMVVTYYDEDDTLVDDKGEVSTDPDKVLGPEALVKFGEGSGDNDVVYVRNLLLRTDYEVVRLHSSYSEKVIGDKKNKRDRTRTNTNRSRKANDIHADDEEE